MSGSDRPARTVGAPLDTRDLLLPADYPSSFLGAHADRIAFRSDTDVLTYRQLDRACDAFVTLARARGVSVGGRIGLLGKNSGLFFVALLGAARAGIVIVPINWRNTAAEIRYVLEDSAVTLVVVEAEFVATLAAAGGNVARNIVLDDVGPDGFSQQLAGMEPAARTHHDPHLPWLQLYTSGTTGRPKGVVTTQHAFACQRRMEETTGYWDEWGDDEVLLSPLPSFHIGGMTWALNATMRGQTTVLTNDASPAGLLDKCLAHGVTRTFIVPTLVRGLIGEMDARNARVSTLRAIHYGAAAMDPALLDRSVDRIGCRFMQYYGMTEATGSITILGPEYHNAAHAGLLRSVGRPLPGFEIEIRGPDKALLAIDQPGEIWVKGPSLFQGYWHKPEATAEAMEDGWYRSGDGGRVNPEGFLFLTDRIKDMIVSGGENVYPAEVEAVLRDHPAILDCAVFGLPHPKWGEGVTAAVEVRPGHVVSGDEVIAFARQALAAYKIPRRIELGVTLPRTAAGKIQRGEIRRRLIDQDSTATSSG